MLATGATNRVIGQKLFRSPHTVAAHIRSILAKTNTTSRMEAANYARRLGLAPEEPHPSQVEAEDTRVAPQK